MSKLVYRLVNYFCLK